MAAPAPARQRRGVSAPSDWKQERVCAYDECDETFMPRHHRQMYHSTRCGERAKVKRKRGHTGFSPRICARDGCDVEFTPTQPRHMYHSDECRDISMREKKRAAVGDKRARARIAKAADSPRSESDAKPAPVAELRVRYVELLFDLCGDPLEEAEVKVAALDRLEKLVGAAG